MRSPWIRAAIGAGMLGAALLLSMCGNGPTWFSTCGGPACRVDDGGDSGDPSCASLDAGKGAPCSNVDQLCDPGTGCGIRLKCTTSDPTNGGACPVSRARFKRDIQYLGGEELDRLERELLGIKLATFRYETDRPLRRHRLGFLRGDSQSSNAGDAEHDAVDLYGYTSMAVATLQVQAKELAALRAEVEAMKKLAAHRKTTTGDDQ